MKKALCLGGCAVLLAGIASWIGHRDHWFVPLKLRECRSTGLMESSRAHGLPQVGISILRLWNELLANGERPSDVHDVFVTPSSYDYYVEHGTWPDKTMFVLEIYGSASKGSINLHGNYQSTLWSGRGSEDEKRFETSGRISDLTRRKVRLL